MCRMEKIISVFIFPHLKIFRNRFFVSTLLCLIPVFLLEASRPPSTFVSAASDLVHYYNDENVVMVASAGRSGSSLLKSILTTQCTNRKIIKTHLLVPDKRFTGKILFTFSRPDRMAESFLHITMGNKKTWWQLHFRHIESADAKWAARFKNSYDQTIEENILSKDVLGIDHMLADRLHVSTQSCSPEDAQITAIKYENLWDCSTQKAMAKFLGEDFLELPQQLQRGYERVECDPLELQFRDAYNLGTESEPIYSAYDKGRLLWRDAPAFQFLNIRSH